MIVRERNSEIVEQISLCSMDGDSIYQLHQIRENLRYMVVRGRRQEISMRAPENEPEPTAGRRRAAT
jgi:hypothetical protein